MIDGIPKGDGTSRLLLGSAPDTYEQFRDLMRSDGIPTDIKLNPEGWAILPTHLNKKSLLRDETTKKIFGNTEDKTVDQALEAVAGSAYKVGDIKVTNRTDLDDTWLLCNGDTIDPEENPELAMWAVVGGDVKEGDSYSFNYPNSDSEILFFGYVGGKWIKIVKSSTFSPSTVRLYFSESLNGSFDYADLTQNPSIAVEGVLYYGGAYVILYRIKDTGEHYVDVSVDECDTFQKVTVQSGSFNNYPLMSIAVHDGLWVITGADGNSGIPVFYATDPRGPWSSRRISISGVTNLFGASVLFDEDKGKWLILSSGEGKAYISESETITGTFTSTEITDSLYLRIGTASAQVSDGNNVYVKGQFLRFFKAGKGYVIISDGYILYSENLYSGYTFALIKGIVDGGTYHTFSGGELVSFSDCGEIFVVGVSRKYDANDGVEGNQCCLLISENGQSWAYKRMIGFGSSGDTIYKIGGAALNGNRLYYAYSWSQTGSPTNRAQIYSADPVLPSASEDYGYVYIKAKEVSDNGV